MSRKYTLSIFLFLLFLNIANLKAQTIQKEKYPLSSILNSLEKRYNISFSYADETIKNKEIILPNEDLTLEALIAFLKNETKLDFKLLDSRFVVIKLLKKEKNDFRVQKLEEVVVTNYLTNGITKLNDGSITIKPESFGILPGLIEPDVLQTIQALPGVLSVDETVSNINVRGGTHDQNLLLWDGIKMYQSGHFFGLISAFNPYTTKRVNVYKNGTSAKYGDGISSIIDIELSDDIDNEFKGGLGFNLINVDGYAKIPLSKKTELQLSTRRSVTDLVVTPTYDQYFKRVFQDSDFSNYSNNSVSQNETFYFYDITAKFLYDISKKDKLRFHLLNVNNRLNYDERSTINNRDEALNSKLSQQNSAIGITYTRDWTHRLSTTYQIYVSNYDLDATNFDIFNDQRLIQENEVYDGSSKFDINYEHNPRLKINGGYQFTEVGISNLEDINNPLFRSYIKNVIRSHAIYAETSLLSNNIKTNVTVGTRLNYINKFKLLLAEPRLRFSQRFFNNFRFEILGEFKHQTTTQIIDLQNDFLGIEKRRWVLANNNSDNIIINSKTIYPVPVIKSKQISAGIHYNKNKLLISAEGYLKKVDGITTRSQGFQNQYQFVNSIGSYDIKGIDLLLNKQFGNTISSWVSYSYNKNNYLFPSLNNGEKFPNNSDIRHTFSFAGTYTQNGIKLAMGLNWHSGKPTTLPDTEDAPDNRDITYASPNSTNLEDYLRADCSASYDFNISNTTRATIGASVWNVLNKKNIINTYYTLDDTNMVNKIENESLGITPNVSLRIHF
ncbi:TonB-dependent receptor plug domain-containing protein [Flavivirga jejuensis]|uniref:TonB-dependent receptor plug domain-containing protein n=1 Tax=Flavivirga jejuensis TaxID=870487 RepID=A0ABT8WJQ7_9FLAO|nr:TonB-dependent receptor plug domain-containing protein [Flavivirga jejuensis]MDO5973342.1 TonB-dependent receptor plug domain-containing protein [Flavivirga jejuensis]